VRPRDREVARRLDEGLTRFDEDAHPLLGIRNAERRKALIEQLLESIHRVRLVSVINSRRLDDRRANPNDTLFDPLKAAILQQRRGNIEEAFWLVFLFVHFGKHSKGGWRYVREIYGQLGGEEQWDWPTTSVNPVQFRAWLDSHENELRRPGVPGGFGNHRKRESLGAYSVNGTGAVVESYISWVDPPRTHQELVQQALDQAKGNPRTAFDLLFNSMTAVRRFGRLARFDYLTMLGKVGLAPISPGSAYLKGATGPVEGARLLFGVQDRIEILDSKLIELDAQLHVGMQVLEDALCNWQKSPDVFKPFRG
jgi:hypothetical protein